MSTGASSMGTRIGVRDAEGVDDLSAEASAWVLAVAEGRLSAVEEREFQSWMQASAENRSRFAELMATWDFAASLAQPVADHSPTLPARSGRPRRSSGTRRRWLAAGASMAAGIAAIAFVAHQSVGVDPIPVELTTAHGERMDHVLPDGSQVSLNGGTRLIFVSSEEHRELELSSGEAYFDVVSDGRPFRVRTSAGTVEVVGTAFNIDVLEPGVAQVAVYHGRVAVDSGTKRMELAEGEQVDLGPGAALVKRMLNGDSPDWRGGWFEASDESLRRVVQETSRFSPLPIELGSPDLAPIRLSGRFHVGEPDRVLAMLEHAHGLRVRREAERIVLLPP